MTATTLATSTTTEEPEMTTDTAELRATLLRRAYEGETIGCAMYQAMIDDPSFTEKEALRRLYVIERVTADALKPLVDRYQVTVDEEAALAEGRRLAAGLHGSPWKQMWIEVTRLADDYLVDFKHLAEVLDGDDAAVGRQVVEHEEALLAFARAEVDDEPDAQAPLTDYLRRYAS